MTISFLQDSEKIIFVNMVKLKKHKLGCQCENSKFFGIKIFWGLQYTQLFQQFHAIIIEYLVYIKQFDSLT